MVPWEDGEAARGGGCVGWRGEEAPGGGRAAGGWRESRRDVGGGGGGFALARRAGEASAVDPKSKLPSSLATEAVGANRNCDLPAPPRRRGLQREGRSHG